MLIKIVVGCTRDSSCCFWNLIYEQYKLWWIWARESASVYKQDNCKMWFVDKICRGLQNVTKCEALYLIWTWKPYYHTIYILCHNQGSAPVGNPWPETRDFGHFAGAGSTPVTQPVTTRDGYLPNRHPWKRCFVGSVDGSSNYRPIFEIWLPININNDQWILKLVCFLFFCYIEPYNYMYEH